MIKEFIDFSSNCPICENNLLLYLQVIDYGCFALLAVEDNTFVFEKINTCKNKDQEFYPERLVYNDYCSNPKLELSNKIKIISSVLEDKKMFFFTMCKDGFEFGDYDDDYIICPYKACYYRDSVLLKRDGEYIIVDPSSSQDTPSFVRGETMSFYIDKKKDDVLYRKHYLLNLKYQEKKSVLYYFQVNHDDLNNPFFELSEGGLFTTKEFPFLANGLNLSIQDREKLIKKFDYWILLS